MGNVTLRVSVASPLIMRFAYFIHNVYQASLRDKAFTTFTVILTYFLAASLRLDLLFTNSSKK
jgi:hypothetical protein